MAAPGLYERAGEAVDSVPVIRLIFGLLIAAGLHLAYVGWIAKPPARRVSEA
jgi:hypothetical protein